MSNKEERFILYEYLLYFWRKKWAFLIVPLITIALAIAIYNFFKPDPYTGKSTVYVGSVDMTELTSGKNILSKYEGQVINEVEISTSNGYVTIEVTGKNRKSVESDLSSLSSDIENDLLEQSNWQIQTTEDDLEHAVERIKSLEEMLTELEKINENIISKEKINDTELEYLTARLNLVAKISDLQSRVGSLEKGIGFFEEPHVLNINVESKSYIVQSTLIGLLLGLALTVAFLSLLKYIEDARRYYSSK